MRYCRVWGRTSLPWLCYTNQKCEFCSDAKKKEHFNVGRLFHPSSKSLTLCTLRTFCTNRGRSTQHVPQVKNLTGKTVPFSKSEDRAVYSITELHKATAEALCSDYKRLALVIPPLWQGNTWPSCATAGETRIFCLQRRQNQIQTMYWGGCQVTCSWRVWLKIGDECQITLHYRIVTYIFIQIYSSYGIRLIFQDIYFWYLTFTKKNGDIYQHSDTVASLQ